MISSKGKNTMKRLPVDIKNQLKRYGLTKYDTDDSNARYSAIVDNTKIFYEEIADNLVQYKGRINNAFNLLLSSDIKQSVINVSGIPRSKNQYGLNFVVYDKIKKEIVDIVWIDVNNPDIIKR